MKFLLIITMLLSSTLLSAESEVLKLMKISCNTSKSARACFNYANLLYRRQQYDEAKIYFKKGCKKGFSPSCKQVKTKNLLNATFVKGKKRKKKINTTDLNNLLSESHKSLRSDDDFVEIVTHFCEKKSKTACLMKKCILDQSKDRKCIKNKKSISNAFKMGATEMKKLSEEIPMPIQEKLNRKKQEVKRLTALCKKNDKKSCKQARIFQMESNMEFLDELNKIITHKLAKECDNGRVDSCFSLEMHNYQMDKLKANRGL